MPKTTIPDLHRAAAACLASLALFAGVAAAVAAARRAEPAPATQGFTLADVAFLQGAWRAEYKGYTLEEHFSAPAHGTIMGMFREQGEGRTILSELMMLEEHDDGVHYFLRHFNPGLVPWEQEADGPMHFRLVEAGNGQAVFEDAQRSFPRQIVYEQPQPGTLVARLVGEDDKGNDRTIEFTYRSMSMTTTVSERLTEAGQSMGYVPGLTISLPVKDMNKAIDFYQDVVGFKLQYKLDEMGWCELTTSVPHVNLGLSQVESPNHGGQTPVFGVEDIDRTRRILEERGARFDGETREIPEMVKLATFFDLDGNPIMLYQSLNSDVP